MKYRLAALALILAATLCLTGCLGSSNSANNSEPAETLNPYTSPEGFFFEEPQTDQKETVSVKVSADGQIAPEGETGEDFTYKTLYNMEKSENPFQMLYECAHVAKEAADLFDTAAGAGDISGFAAQYAYGMKEYETQAVRVLGKNGLKIVGVLTEDTDYGSAGNDAVILAFPLDKHIVQFKAAGSGAEAAIGEVISSVRYTASEEAEAPQSSGSGEESSQS